MKILLAVLPLFFVTATSAPSGDDGRWRFGNPEDAEWVAIHEQKLEAIDHWWEQFEAESMAIELLLSSPDASKLVAWMTAELPKVSPEIMWEFGPGLETEHRLVLTPESNHSLRPLVTTLLERAPKLDGWEFYGDRLPESMSEARRVVRARGYRSLAGTKVLVTRGPDHTVDLCFYNKGYTGPDDRDAFNSIFVCTETVLGGRDLNLWVGDIRVEKGEHEDAVRLSSLATEFASAVDSLVEELPGKPQASLDQDEQTWTAWQLQPQEYLDYPGQFDLSFASSSMPAMWQASHSGWIFNSERFSKHGEIFCYVKLERSPEDGDDLLATRTRAEEALNKALQPGGLGTTVGFGTGLRYSYIELCLVDVDAGIQAAREALAKAKVPQRTWILFHDAAYENEWVGAYSETGAPPR